ncbi:hypothetical protein BS17DRAFT_316030 [Gyrodon lividus]|nr:hypothetical protein BS17DRAFT_316030 [Gyrodon lividus]
MPAPQSVLEYPCTAAGELGGSNQIGKLMGAILAGLRQSSSPSSNPGSSTPTSGSTETTKELSKVGAGDVATTAPPTRSSSVFTPPWAQPSLHSTSNTFPAPATQRTPSHAAYISPYISSSPQSQSQPELNTSFSTSASTPRRAGTPQRLVCLATTVTHPNRSTTPGSPAHTANLTPNPRTPQQPSNLCPNCPARSRLLEWTPLQPRSSAHPFSPGDTQWIYDVITHAWSESTRITYGSGLLTFHAFCDSKDIPEGLRAPASPDLISVFISTMASLYSNTTIVNYVSGVRAWHIIHGLAWNLNETETNALLKASKVLSPPTSKHAPREPYTIETIVIIRGQLDLDTPIGTAVFACLTTT